MLTRIHSKRGLQLVIGLMIGITFGFLLQKGGVARYEIILGQLLLEDFTVVKIMMTAVLVGMIGIYTLKGLGLVQLHIKPGSVGMNVMGGLLFGVAFALLGYCPGTLLAGIASGYLDALAGGLVGMLVGAALYAAVYPWFNEKIAMKGYFGEKTFPELLKLPAWVVVIIFSIMIGGILFLLENAGL